jgi:Flp pilus assembly pilin Flp
MLAFGIICCLGRISVVFLASKKLIKRFIADKSAATAIEYGVIIAILSLAIIGSGDTVWVVIREKFVMLGSVITTGNR